MPRFFTLQEANAALILIRPLMDEIQNIRNEILAHQPETWEAVRKSAGNGGSPVLSRMVKRFDRLDDLLHQILATGVQVKDINTGLLDFSATREGREVYLCWMYGENDIAFWHEVDAGFAGRRPIEEF
jgi:hypothetical protein